MTKSRRSLKRRRRLAKRKNIVKEEIFIPPKTKSLINKINDENIDSNERASLADQIYNKDGKLHPHLYKRVTRQVKK